MGAAYKNIDAKYSAITFVHGIWRDATNEFLDTTFESGDEIYVVAMNRDSTQPVLPCDDPLGYTPSNFPWATLAKMEQIVYGQ